MCTVSGEIKNKSDFAVSFITEMFPITFIENIWFCRLIEFKSSIITFTKCEKGIP